jgi:hypothetical protein
MAGLFGGSKNQDATQTSADAAQMAQDGADFLNSYAGEGTQGIDQRAVSMAYLTILQDRSDAVVNKVPGAEPGLFFNTAAQKVLATEVEVIPVAFKLVWDERDKGGKTVMRYEPNTVEYREEAVPVGQRGFPKKINPTTGFEIVETFAYALVLKDFPEMGFLMHTAGLGSMKTYRRWNTMLKQMRLPNGQQAPIFAKSWKLVAESKISKTTNQPFYALANVLEGDWLNKELFTQAVLPAREVSAQLLIEATADAMSMTAEE